MTIGHDDHAITFKGNMPLHAPCLESWSEVVTCLLCSVKLGIRVETAEL